MSVIIFAELFEGKLKKNTWEAAAFATAFAEASGKKAIAIAIGKANPGELETLGKAGIVKVLHADAPELERFCSKAYTKVLKVAADQEGADTIVLSHNSSGKTIAPRIAVRCGAALLAGISAQPNADGSFKKSLFSGKAWGQLTASADKKVITISPNATSFILGEGTSPVEKLDVSIDPSDIDYKVLEVINESAGMVPLPEAEKVVSAGRGMKGPENWGIIEELAKELGATTACSRPVADIGWRPHHEHVGQTGIAIKPNLYIAIGISGAIQHLAGVNQSKCIVVINKDPEAPFFKAADYGIVGDAFEVVPKLIAAVKELNSKG